MLPSLAALSVAPTGVPPNNTEAPNDTEAFPLVVLFDYDRCLKNLIGDLNNVNELRKIVVTLIFKAADRVGAGKIVLLSYSNRVCTFYNTDIQKDQNEKPTKDAIIWLGQLLMGELLTTKRHFTIEPRHGLKRDPNPEYNGYLVDGEAWFSENLPSDLKEEWKKQPYQVKRALSETPLGVRLKTDLYYNAKKDNEGATFLVFDDKWENLQMHEKHDDTDVVHFMGGVVSMFLKHPAGRSLADTDPAALWDAVVNKQDWFQKMS